MMLWSSGYDAGGARRPRAEALSYLRRAQGADGGWGPYAETPSEVFDTALALLALAERLEDSGVREMIRRGRGFLVYSQLPDGSWPATTRPSGGISYAQQMSTTGWAALALIATRTVN
jgi:squalene cyclase